MPLSVLALAALVSLVPQAPASGRAAMQDEPGAANVQVHVGGDPDLREQALTVLRSHLQAARRISVVDQDAEYVLSLVVLPISSGGFAVSATVMRVHTDGSLAALATLWELNASITGRLRAMFSGSGALVDQRVLTGPDLESLCADVARAFVADVVGPSNQLPRR